MKRAFQRVLRFVGLIGESRPAPSAESDAALEQEAVAEPIQEEVPAVAEKADPAKPRFSKPRICLVDLKKEVTEALVERGFSCREATLGPVVEIPNTVRKDSHACLLGHTLPPNLHEFDLVVLDLTSTRQVPYNPEDHQHTDVRSSSTGAFICKYPQNQFDPRPAVIQLVLRPTIDELLNSHFLLVAFVGQHEKLEYRYRKHTISEGAEEIGPVAYSNFAFLRRVPIVEKRIGTETKSAPGAPSQFRELLDSRDWHFVYESVFQHPRRWDKYKKV